MNRPFYSEYVRHCLRFYTRNLELRQFKSHIDKSNWCSCHSVIKTLSERDRDIVVSVYSGYDTLADNVYEVAKKHDIDQAIIWDMMKDIERKIAKRRELML
jgi:hypothetical protein